MKVCVLSRSFLFHLDLKAGLLWCVCACARRALSVLFRPVTAASSTVCFTLSTPSCLSTKEVQGLTLRPSGLCLGPCNQKRGQGQWLSGAATSEYCPKISHAATVLCCSILTFPLVAPLHSTNCSIPFSPTYLWSTQLCSQCPAPIFFLLFKHPHDPVSGP